MQDLVGKRIKLVKMVYDTPIAPGTTGKVTKIDGVGLIHVKWKAVKGKPVPMRGLCVDPDTDTFEILG
jgi:hypothetical protein